MNVKRFTARTAREALALVREALGEDAVVLSTKPSGEGVEVLALAPEGLARIAQAAAQAPVQRAVPAPGVAPALPLLAAAAAPAAAPTRSLTLTERIAARGERLEPRGEGRMPQRIEPGLLDDTAVPPRLDASRNAGPEPLADASVARDVETLGMSTLTFQDYVRERMLKRRQAELAQPGAAAGAAPGMGAALAAAVGANAQPPANAPANAPGPMLASAMAAARHALPAPPAPGAAMLRTLAGGPRRDDAPPERHAALRERLGVSPEGNTHRREPPVLRDEVRPAGSGRHDLLGPGRVVRLADGPGASLGRPPEEGLVELRGELQSVRALIDERFGMLAFMERLQRDPRQATLSQKLFDAGLSPALVRKLVQSLPDAGQAPDELAWAAGVLAQNLRTDEHDLPLEDHDGVLALIGATGVGKTTSTAKLAAAFAAKHGAAHLGLITLDAYRVAAHEQLRTYGRILGVPVHTAHDRASLEDLLDLLSAKKLVLIDTAGMAQRDARTKEMLDMLQHRAIHKLLVINAAAQGETVEDVMVAYGVQQCHGVIVSKLDEAVKLGPALDALIRHRARVVGVANGQRVPEDWHRLSAQALVQRALRGGGSASWKLDAGDVNLVFAAIHGAGYPKAQATATALPFMPTSTVGQGAPLPV